MKNLFSPLSTEKDFNLSPILETSYKFIIIFLAILGGEGRRIEDKMVRQTTNLMDTELIKLWSWHGQEAWRSPLSYK